MIHKIELDFNLDDDRIVSKIAENAERALVKKLSDEAEAVIYAHRDCFGKWDQCSDKNRRIGVGEAVKEAIKEFIEENKEDIMNRTAKELAKRMYTNNKKNEIIRKMEAILND